MERVNSNAVVWGAVVVLAVLGLTFGGMIGQTVPKGHVAVTSSFGDIRSRVYPAGLHFPVVPWWGWDNFHIRQKPFEVRGIGVPTQDKLVTKFDLNVQYQVIPEMAPVILGETGNTEQVIAVHLEPKTRSLLRDVGKTIEKAEDLFTEGTQERLQTVLETRLAEYMQPKGIAISAVLLRNIELPALITVAQAEAEKNAAEQEAEKQRLLADARAYEIEAINEALANAPGYIQLQALRALEEMSKNPASQIYFMDGQATMPLPLMHMGNPSPLDASARGDGR